MSETTGITEAPAATGTALGHAPAMSASEAFMRDASSWVLVSFVIFMVLVVRYLGPMITKGLDGRANTIRDQLEQASRLRAEAEELLARCKLQQEELLAQAESIIAGAKRDAASLRTNAAEELKASLDRRAEQAKDKIERAADEAVETIRTRIIETATQKTSLMLAQNANAATQEQLVAKAIATIEQQVH